LLPLHACRVTMSAWHEWTSSLIVRAEAQLR
jgi:hypothetical protein